MKSIFALLLKFGVLILLLATFPIVIALVCTLTESEDWGRCDS